MVVQSPAPVPRTFAELPLIRPWESMRQHLTRLDGAEETSFTCEDSVYRLQFEYYSYSFQLYGMERAWSFRLRTRHALIVS